MKVYLSPLACVAPSRAFGSFGERGVVVFLVGVGEVVFLPASFGLLCFCFCNDGGESTDEFDSGAVETKML